ncbi:MAG TPA: hypothetical protein VGJ56_02760 [Reyranella sp.]|jgi:hypothetical protein
MVDSASGPVVVAGDVSIDWLAWPFPPDTAAGGRTVANWRHREGTRMVARRGGALLLRDLLGKALPSRPVIGPKVPKDLHDLPPEEILHSIVDLALQEKAFRIQRLRGFSGPLGKNPPPPNLDGSVGPADVLVLDDSGNGFRDAAEFWKEYLETAKPRWLVLKMARPLAKGPMWDRVRQGPLNDEGKPDPQRLVIVLNAEDLREEGYGLTRPLTWERTAEEFAHEVKHRPAFKPLRDCAHLIVRFDCDGVIHYCGGKTPTATLCFDPHRPEGGFVSEQGGRMMGMTAAFTAGLVAVLAADPNAMPGQAVGPAMAAAHKLAQAGFVTDATDGEPNYPLAATLPPALPTVSSIEIPLEDMGEGKPWSILHARDSGNMVEIARRIVVRGPDAVAGIPIAAFGDLRTADRREIEAFRAIANLLAEYLGQAQSKPISIGVFGRPGAGKSFGVTEVAKAVSKAKKVQKLEFNLSQLASPAELNAAFHLVRDCSLKGDVPLAFFDEFDCELEGEPLGWLSSFLAPMQDGTFLEGGHAHPIGPAIFVFAGGTSATYRQFVTPDDRKRFTAAKGPDFASRLRGTVDILGPDWLGGEDPYSIRRAFLLRSLIERFYKPLISKRDKTIDIAKEVLDVLLTVRGLRHGARSIETILAMSGLGGRNRFTRAALPPLDQLDLHVDAEDFMGRVNKERLDYDLREALGKRLHEAYRKKKREVFSSPEELAELKDDVAMKDWKDLDEAFRESSRLQADDIPRKLEAIGHRMVKGKIKDHAPLARFEKAAVDKLARAEHDRFVAERTRKDWRLGKGPRDLAGKTSPHLKGWDEIGKNWQQLDVSAVLCIPDVLAEEDYYIYPQPAVGRLPPDSV